MDFEDGGVEDGVQAWSWSWQISVDAQLGGHDRKDLFGVGRLLCIIVVTSADRLVLYAEVLRD